MDRKCVLCAKMRAHRQAQAHMLIEETERMSVVANEARNRLRFTKATRTNKAQKRKKQQEEEIKRYSKTDKERERERKRKRKKRKKK